ncbi:glycosyl hydrolase-related protein [Streptomyces poriferorum]|uniref:glycosyl hydrolase-related protein n=1 Tax=Streptomyces poriferorum TaxID=2798799 RepID=UPI00353234B3
MSTVEPVDGASGDPVARLYGSTGGRAKVRLTAGFEAGGVTACDLPERPPGDATAAELHYGGVELALRPFELIAPRFTRGCPVRPSPAPGPGEGRGAGPERP